MNIQWNTADYTKNFDFIHKYGEAVEKIRPVLFKNDGWIIDYVRIRVRARKR